MLKLATRLRAAAPGYSKPGDARQCQQGRGDRNLSHSPWFQRVRPENNLLFRLSFRVGKEGMKWVQGTGGCDSTDT